MEIDKLKERCETAKAATLGLRERIREVDQQVRAALKRGDGTTVLTLKQSLPALHVELLREATAHDVALKAFIAARNPPLEAAVKEAEAGIAVAKKKRNELEVEIKHLIAEADREVARTERAHTAAFEIYRNVLDADITEQSEIQQSNIVATAHLQAA